MDTYEGDRDIPLTLNKYIYNNSDPSNGVDPTGYLEFSLDELTATQQIGAILLAIGVAGTVST